MASECPGRAGQPLCPGNPRADGGREWSVQAGTAGAVPVASRVAPHTARLNSPTATMCT